MKLSLASIALFIMACAAKCDTLRFGSPESVGMLSAPLHEMVKNLTHFTEARNWGSATHKQVVPVEPGGTVLVAHKGVIVSYFGFGKRRLWASVDGFNGTKLPVDQQEDATPDTIYDMASLTKLYTTVAALRCLDKGLFDLNGTVATWLPEFGSNGKEEVTVLQLLTHTSGLQPDPEVGLYMPQFPTYESKVHAILDQKLINPPGAKFVYSDLNFMTLMLLVEKTSGKKLDEAIHEFTSVMRMKDTFFNRGNKALNDHRIAPQEFQIAVLGKDEPQRPQPVWCTVHDENAYGLNGVSGHAGLFSTVLDSARFAQMILNNGTYGGHRILSQQAVDWIFTNFNERFGPDNAHGLGFELNQYYTSGPMANLLAASHTGFTGTSMVIDRASNTAFLHFSNRVHPSRNWSSNNIARETVGAWVATALGRKVQFPYV